MFPLGCVEFVCGAVRCGAVGWGGVVSKGLWLVWVSADFVCAAVARLPLKLGYWDTREGEGLPAPRMPPDPGPPAREGKLDYWPEARGQGVVRGLESQ